MTNEELAIEIQKGNKEACLQLWEQVQNFIKKSAFCYYNNLKNLGKEYMPDTDDLISEGYIAMLRAVKYYSPDKGYKFITYLKNTLKNSFAEASGGRTVALHNEPLNNCRSLNTFIDNESEGTELVEMVADETAYDAFSRIELSETQQIVADAVAKLSESDQRLIRLRYWDELSLTDIAKILGVSSSTVVNREHKALRKLRFNDDLKALYIAFKKHYKGFEI